VPVGDTLKRVDQSRNESVRQVRETVDRRGLWRAQTPQGFPRAVLQEAYARHDQAPQVTDDAQLVERIGKPVVLVPDRATNIKVTTADDFVLAEALASR
jgi:2-C-methyl-D-erythritol 4-phosphate cytidylyltransferase